MEHNSPEVEREYDKVFTGADYTREMPKWLKTIAKEEVSTFCQCLDNFLKDERDSNQVFVLDIGSGNGTRTSEFIYHMSGKCQPRVTCTDISQIGLDRIQDTAVEHVIQEDVNDENWSIDRKYDLIMSFGLTPHVDDLRRFLTEVFWMGNHSIIHFARNDTAEALRMATEAFEDHGFVYNAQNERTLTAAIASILKLSFPGAIRQGFEYKIRETPVGLILCTKVR